MIMMGKRSFELSDMVREVRGQVRCGFLDGSSSLDVVRVDSRAVQVGFDPLNVLCIMGGAVQIFSVCSLHQGSMVEVWFCGAGELLVGSYRGSWR